MLLSPALLVALILASALPVHAASAPHLKAELEKEILARKIPAAIYAVVYPGQPVEYGAVGAAEFAHQLGQPQPVLADHTLFRIASISKLFTAVAVLQQVERGTLTLDRPVLEYVPEIPLRGEWAKQITLRHLLTHTAGFDEVYVNIAARTKAHFIPFDQWVHQFVPQIIAPPGTMQNYSNYGFALAGYVLEKTLGAPYTELMYRQVLEPLGMTESHFDRTPEREARMPVGHEIWLGKLRRTPNDWAQAVPASSLETTAHDMAIFLQFMLEPWVLPAGKTGHANWAKVLSLQGRREMQKTQYRADPNVSGFGFSFAENQHGTIREVTHGGDVRGGSSFFSVFPEKKAGYFISYNRMGWDLNLWMRSWFDQTVIHPGPLPPARDTPLPTERATPPALAGIYRYSRYPHFSFTKIGAFLGGMARDVEITALSPDTIGFQIIGPAGNGKLRPASVYRQVARGVYESPDQGDRFVFVPHPEHPDLVRMLPLNGPHGVYDRIPRWRSFTFQIGLAFLAILAALGVVLHQVIRRPARATLPSQLASGLMALTLALPLGWAGAIYFIPPIEAAYGVPLPYRAMFLFTWGLGALTLAWLALHAHSAMRRRHRENPAPLILTLIAGVTLSTLFAVLWEWNFY